MSFLSLLLGWFGKLLINLILENGERFIKGWLIAHFDRLIEKGQHDFVKYLSTASNFLDFIDFVVKCKCLNLVQARGTTTIFSSPNSLCSILPPSFTTVPSKLLFMVTHLFPTLLSLEDLYYAPKFSYFLALFGSILLPLDCALLESNIVTLMHLCSVSKNVTQCVTHLHPPPHFNLLLNSPYHFEVPSKT